jgi:hypothetical protein
MNTSIYTLLSISITGFLAAVSCKVAPKYIEPTSSLMNVGASISICPIENTFISDSFVSEEDNYRSLQILVDKLEVTGQSCSLANEGLSLVARPRTIKLIIERLQKGWVFILNHLDGTKSKNYLENSSKFHEEILDLQKISKRALHDSDHKSWVDFVRSISKNGTLDDSLRSSLIPAMRNLSPNTRSEILDIIKKEYPSAYHNKHKIIGDGWPPKRAFDVILRYLIPPEQFFKKITTKSDALNAWNNFLKAQKKAVFDGSDFGSYTADDVHSIAKRMQEFLKQQPANGENVEILIKGSFPAGKANLHKRNPLENIADAVLQGRNSSYSDIDFLINKTWQKRIKEIEPDIYNYLVSDQAKNIVSKSGAKPFFQTHPNPFDLYAELDGSMMSPVGLRVNKEKITLVVYNQIPVTEIPSKEVLNQLSQADKQKIYDKWANFYEL